MKKYEIWPVLAFLLIATFANVSAQSSSTANGYFLEGEDVIFVFNEKDYGITPTPTRVVVTGAFRGWSQDMDESRWQLTFVQSGRWELKVNNAEFKTIAAGSPFKFRINEGEWLSPPPTASNEQGGNLVFMSDIKPAKLVGDIDNEYAIWATLEGDQIERSWKAEDWRIHRFDGQVIEVEEVMPNTASKLLIRPKVAIDPKRVHYLEYLPAEMKVMCRFDSWFQSLYSTKVLGAEVSEDRNYTDFRLFAPRAEMVKLHLYNGKNDAKPEQSIKMKMDAQGVWEYRAEGDLFKKWYDFSVHGPANEPGSHYFEQTGTHVSDPYARVNDDAFGKSRVWYKGEPASPLKTGIPAYEDVIAYEVHVQDFTDLLPVNESIKGTFPAMIQPGLKNETGAPIGFDHLVELGINTVHLMPVQEYLHYKDEEWQAAFKDNAFMKEQAINMENYQWGYRITHAMAVENRFRQKGTEHGTEREQFRDLIQAFHDQNMAVIVDYVFNHTGENMDGRHYNMNFNGIDKHYYYRLDGNGEHIGAFGNETKSENRPMMQRWIIDQCVYFIEEFGVDGFRIDLAGQTDQQTLIKLMDTIGRDKIVYGEPWIGSNDPEYEANPDWDWYKIDSPITFFQDDSRNAFKGPPSIPTDKMKDRGYAGGKLDERQNAMDGLMNNYKEEPTPNAGINYLDIHDNWALADRFASEDWDGRKGVDEARMKIATALLFTSAGPIVLHGGTEFMRSKALAELKQQILETASGKLYFHGKSDSYNLRAANHFVWENVGTNPENGPNYADMHAWWKGIIALRMSEFGEVVRIGEALADDHYQFTTPENPALLGYTIGNRIAVAMNVGKTKESFSMPFGEGNWMEVANIEQVNLNGTGGKTLQAGEFQISLNATDLKIWVNKAR